MVRRQLHARVLASAFAALPLRSLSLRSLSFRSLPLRSLSFRSAWLAAALLALESTASAQAAAPPETPDAAAPVAPPSVAPSVVAPSVVAPSVVAPSATVPETTASEQREPAASADSKPTLSLEALGIAQPGPARAVDYNAAAPSRTAANFLWPLLDVLGANLAFWGISYASGAPFAKITPKIWKENFGTGFQWDDNEFEVNQFAHPWQGGLYFSAARVNGLTFWESAPYTVFGSWTWEHFAETEQPATNDFLTTTWGGTFFGEALYRLSNDVLDDSTSGSNRLWKEIAGFVLSPMNGIDRLISGQAWADGPPGKHFPLLFDLRVGPDGLGLSQGTGWGKIVSASLRVDYGDLYAKPSIDTPFEYFNAMAGLGVGKDILGEAFDGTGVLLGNRFSIGSRDVDMIAWTMGYEYFTNGTTKVFTRDSAGVYSLGALTTGVSWFSHWGLGSGFSVDGELDALAVPNGSITSPYAKYESNRSYNYGVGGAGKAEVSLRHERLGRLYANFDRYLYYVVDGASGVESLGTLRLGVYANLYKGHGLGASVIRYDRHSSYDDYAQLDDAFWSGQFHYELEF
jgi:hypothetical protein